MTEVVVPDGWTKARLGDLGRYINGRGFKKSEWGASGRPIIRIQNLTGSSNSFNYFDGEVADRHVVRPGDLLISWAATLGAYFWAGPEGLLNQHIFRVESSIEPRFHKYLLDFKIDELYAQTHGSGMVHITRGKFDAIEVLLPPRDEQRQIVEILESHLSRLDSGAANLTSAEVRLGLVTDSFTGAAPELLSAPMKTLGQVLAMPLGNGKSVPTATEGFPVLRLTAMRDGVIDLNERKTGQWSAEDALSFRVSEGDVFAARGNGSLKLVGRAARVADVPDPVAYPDTMIRIRPDPNLVRADYLTAVWNSRIVRRQIEARARTTAGIYKVNQTDLRGIMLPVPSLEEQRVFVERVNDWSYAVRATLRSVQKAKRRETALRRSLLAAAFSGRLTGSTLGIDRAEEMAGV